MIELLVSIICAAIMILAAIIIASRLFRQTLEMREELKEDLDHEMIPNFKLVVREASNDIISEDNKK